MTPLSMPWQPRRADLVSLWVVLSALAGVLSGVIGALAGLGGLSTGLGVAVTTVLPGLLWPRRISIPYRAWNALASRVARLTAFVLKSVCFFVILLAVGRAGAKLALAAPIAPGSLWVPRRASTPTIAYLSLDETSSTRTDPPHWIPAYARWALSSGNAWAMLLLPFLIVIAIVERAEEERVPGHVYTLY